MPILNRKLKSIMRPFIPARIRHAFLARQADQERYRSGTPAQIFGSIYRDGIWGSGDDFMSGGGSRDEAVVLPYVAAVRRFAGDAATPLVAVDLGCGDFAVGSLLVDCFAEYRACDVVPALISRNRARFTDPRLSFEVVDLVDDPLPPGDVAMIRQVFQHLSNQQIMAVLPKLDQYRFLIVTEHIPSGEFQPNADKQPGPHIRLATGSGVVLDARPFDLPREGRVVCRVETSGSIIETTIWGRNS